MRCRKASSTAQSLQHIWISDSQLSEAFHRFARVSNTQHRRHGSNVPGPLEARRRLARRRMGMMTLDRGGGGVPPAEEAGVLFGFGRTGPPIGSEFAKMWKYQAPLAPQQIAEQRLAERRGDRNQHWPATRSDGSLWDADQEPQQSSTEQEALVNEFFHVSPMAEMSDTSYVPPMAVDSDSSHVPPMAVDSDSSHVPPMAVESDSLYVPPTAAKEAPRYFEELLEEIRNTETLSGTKLVFVWRQLRRTLESPDGDRLIQVVHALSSHSVPSSTWVNLANILRKKLSFKSVTRKETLSILQLVLEREQDWENASSTLAHRVGYTWAKETLLDVIEYIIETPEHHAKLHFWCTLVHMHHPEIRDGRVDSTSWKRFYDLLSKNFKPSDPCVALYFGDMRNDHFAQILLGFYLPVWIDETVQLAKAGSVDVAAATAVNDTETAETQFRTMDYGGTSKGIYMPYWNSSHEGPPAQTRERRSKVLAAIRASNLRQVAGKLRRFIEANPPPPSVGHTVTMPAIVELLALLHQHKLPYVHLLDEVFAVYMKAQSPRTMKDLFLELRNQTYCAIPTSLAGKLIQHFLATGKVENAFYVFRSTPTLPLLPYAELLLKLIEGGKTRGDKIFEMLQRYHPEERLPSMWRQHRRLDLKPEHVNLVHDVAYAFASSEHLSPRTAFRRVWECFRFLQDRRAPLQPLISRALVKAGISRALNEQQRLSKEQVRYIISIVEQVEGPDVAREVDRMVWDSWKWNLERQWALNLPKPAKGPDGQGRFYENKRRLWTNGGGGQIYMPFSEAVEAVEAEAEPNVYHDDAPEFVEERSIFKVALPEVDSVGDTVEKYEPMEPTEPMEPWEFMKPRSSPAETNDFVEDLPDPKDQTEIHASTEPRIIASESEQPSSAEINGVLSAPLGTSSGTDCFPNEHMATVSSITGNVADNTSPAHVEATDKISDATEEAPQAYKVPTRNMRLRKERDTAQAAQNAERISRDHQTETRGEHASPSLIRRYKTEKEHRPWVLCHDGGEAEMLSNDNSRVIRSADAEPAVADFNEVLGATSEHTSDTKLNHEPAIGADSPAAAVIEDSARRGAMYTDDLITAGERIKSSAGIDNASYHQGEGHLIGPRDKSCSTSPHSYKNELPTMRNSRPQQVTTHATIVRDTETPSPQVRSENRASASPQSLIRLHATRKDPRPNLVWTLRQKSET